MGLRTQGLPALCLCAALALTAYAADTPEIDAVLESTRQLAGTDKYLKITQALQCNDNAVGEERSGPRPGAPNIIVEPTRIFDNLYYLGGTRTGSWLFTTSEGYIMVDAMYGNSPEEILIPGMRELGLDPALLKYILISHAGPDHAGGAKYFQEHYGTRIVMSQQDWDGILNPRPGSWVLDDRPKEERPAQEREWVGPPNMDLVGSDGQKLTLGDTTVTMAFTPRRASGGGLSFIIPVMDDGTSHMWATYGNAGAPRSHEDRGLHRRSLKHFLAYMEEAQVDVLTSSHPFVDGSTERMKELADRQPDEANPFVIGHEDATSYINILDQCTALKMIRNEAGLDDFGNPRN